MKNHLFTLAVVAFILTGSLITGCDTSDQKVDTAEKNLEVAKKDLTQAELDEKMAQEQTNMSNEWKVFKDDMHDKIVNNESKIAELKKKMETSGKKKDAAYTKQIETLVTKNEGLRIRLDEFDNNQTDWDKFKREFDHDMGELGKAFKELGVDSSN